MVPQTGNQSLYAAGSTNPLSFRAAVKTDAGAAAAANTDGTKVRFARQPGATRYLGGRIEDHFHYADLH
jgi:hypothetical protein